MSGLFTAVAGTLENGMGTYVTNVSSALASALVPAVTTAVTIWVLAYGLALVRGEAHESVPAFAWRGLKLALILAFALGSGVYQAQVVGAVNGVTAGLAQTIQRAAGHVGASNAGCGSASGSGATGTSAQSIYQTLDCYDQQVDLVMDAYFEQATHEGFGVSGIVAGLGDFLCGLVAALGGSIFLMVLAFEVVMARMLLDLVLGLGPLFIACAAFAPSARFFEAWTAKVANYALLQLLVSAFLGMALAAFSSNLATFHVSGLASGADAASVIAGAQQNLSGVASLASALGLFVTGIFLAMVGWQLPAVASGLAGGATLSGFGSFAAALASRQVTERLAFAWRGSANCVRSGDPSRPGPIASGVSARGDARSGMPERGAHVPAYQRAAREHLDSQDE